MTGILLCAWRDSNPHAVRHQILSLARLPITPHAQHYLNWFANVVKLNQLILTNWYFLLL